jgi:hypothetical protein
MDAPSTNTLASSVFQTGPDSKLSVVDVYNQKSSSVVNSFQDLLDSISKGILTNVKSLSSSDIKSIVSAISTGKLTPSVTSIITRMVGNNSSLLSSVNKMSSDTKSSFSIPNFYDFNVGATLGNTTSKISGSSISDAYGIGGALETLTNGQSTLQINDNPAMSGFISGITSQASSMGLSNVFSSISNGLTSTLGSNATSVLLSSAKSLLPSVIGSGNTSLFIDIAKSAIGGNLSSCIPNLAKDISKTFKIPQGITQTALSTLYSDFKTAANTVSPSWTTYTRSGTTAYDASNGLTNSDYMSALQTYTLANQRTLTNGNLNTSVIEETYPLLAGSFSTQTVSDSLSSTYSSVPITMNSSQSLTDVSSSLTTGVSL